MKKPLSEIYKEAGIQITFPIRVKNNQGKNTYYENSTGYWSRYEYDESGNETCFENSNGFWARSEYDESGNETYYENSIGYWARSEYDESGNITYYENRYIKRGTPRKSCADGKVINIDDDGQKYKLSKI